jgi:hypothetical protein
MAGKFGSQSQNSVASLKIPPLPIKTTISSRITGPALNVLVDFALDFVFIASSPFMFFKQNKYI